jgi:hypothetical protein
VRRYGLTALAAGALLLVAAGSGGADGTSTGACKRPAGYVVAVRTSKAVVFKRRSGHGAYGCLRRRGELVRLSGAVGKYRLAGKYVAYFLVFTEIGQGNPVYRVMVRGLRHGSFRHIEAAYSDLPQQGYDDGENAARVTNLKLKSNGSVAWISCFPSNRHPRRCRAPAADLEWEVWRADTHGRKLLDSSDSVRLRSLGLNRSTLTWRHGDETRTAAIR